MKRDHARLNERPPAGARIGAPTSLTREMATFDALPPRVQRLLANCPFKLLSELILRALDRSNLAVLPCDGRIAVTELAFRQAVARLLALAEQEQGAA